MTKAYEKDKCFPETEKERRIPIYQISPPITTAVNDTNENLGSISKKTCHSREQIRNVQITYRKIEKVQKNWDRQPTKYCEKCQDHELIKTPPYQIPDIIINKRT